MSAPEGSGWSTTCPCGWLVWNSSRVAVDAAEHVHAKKCGRGQPS